MGFLDSILGTSTDSREEKIKELWHRLNKMQNPQLVDICKERPNVIQGQLAYLLLQKNSPAEARKVLNSIGEAQMMSVLESLYRQDVILMGLSEETGEIRELLKKVLKK